MVVHLLLVYMRYALELQPRLPLSQELGELLADPDSTLAAVSTELFLQPQLRVRYDFYYFGERGTD